MQPGVLFFVCHFILVTIGLYDYQNYGNQFLNQSHCHHFIFLRLLKYEAYFHIEYFNEIHRSLLPIISYIVCLFFFFLWNCITQLSLPLTWSTGIPTIWIMKTRNDSLAAQLLSASHNGLAGFKFGLQLKPSTLKTITHLFYHGKMWLRCSGDWGVVDELIKRYGIGYIRQKQGTTTTGVANKKMKNGWYMTKSVHQNVLDQIGMVLCTGSMINNLNESSISREELWKSL